MLLRREASTRAIHKVEAIEVWRFEPAFLDALEGQLDRNMKLELARDDGGLYVTPVGGEVIEGTVTGVSLV